MFSDFAGVPHGFMYLEACMSCARKVGACHNAFCSIKSSKVAIWRISFRAFHICKFGKTLLNWIKHLKVECKMSKTKTIMLKENLRTSLISLFNILTFQSTYTCTNTYNMCYLPSCPWHPSLLAASAKPPLPPAPPLPLPWCPPGRSSAPGRSSPPGLPSARPMSTPPVLGGKSPWHATAREQWREDLRTPRWRRMSWDGKNMEISEEQQVMPLPNPSFVLKGSMYMAHVPTSILSGLPFIISPPTSGVLIFSTPNHALLTENAWT